MKNEKTTNVINPNRFGGGHENIQGFVYTYDFDEWAKKCDKITKKNKKGKEDINIHDRNIDQKYRTREI